MHTARLQYDRIIITGASSGFGEAFAGTLAPHTAELVLIARNEAALRQLAAALQQCALHRCAHGDALVRVQGFVWLSACDLFYFILYSRDSCRTTN